jgi:hypothetical protein
VAVAKGDLVAVEGKLTRRDAGEKTYNNLSAVGINVLGQGATSSRPSVANPVADDEDLPF